ncbi:MAG: hypothetical protein N2380_09265 [bacterium]|nr:hypothetical protein [bacterium]
MRDFKDEMLAFRTLVEGIFLAKLTENNIYAMLLKGDILEIVIFEDVGGIL